MTPSRERIGVLSGCLAAGLVVVAVHLWFLMVHQQETWSARSHENRWAFRAVPSQRGALLDRHGRPLAYDEPTTELAVHYVVWRRRSPVGAAVHGASTWAREQLGPDAPAYDYGSGPRGPLAALHDLMAMPVRVLAPGALSKATASELASAVTTVLAGCSGRPRAKVFARLRAAARAGDGRTMGEVAEPSYADVLDPFAERVAALRALDAAIAAVAAQRAEAAAAVAIVPVVRDEARGLLATLELLRRASLDGTRVTWTTDGVEHHGSKLEAVRRTFAQQVPFDVAAELRVAADRFPGLEVLPAVARVRTVAPSPLRVLLGDVVDLERAVPSERELAARVERELPDDWLEDLAPADEAGTTIDRDQVAAEAREHYVRQLLQHERRGTTGLENAFDDELTGRLGLRLVEQDSRRREHRQWSHLRVQSGADVRTTIDLDLQQIAERATARAFAQMRAMHESADDGDKVEAALAVIDANTGDVLAYAGAPVVSDGPRDLPGVVWVQNGALGSVVKPFVLVEQLHREGTDQPHVPIASLEPCSKTFRYQGRLFRCGAAHWAGGRDPIEALADSCNFFYYQCSVGLGEAGIAHALRRFGLCAAEQGNPFAACWQPRVRGLPAAPPKWARVTELPQRAIGYGVEASPLHVARAYAAFATGCLPTLGFRPEARPRVPLDDVVSEIATVQQGLRACVQHGTAKSLPLLNELGCCGKTGTAEVGDNDENNAWFAGYLPPAGTEGAQLCFCAVVYFVKDKIHGGDAAGQIVVDFLTEVQGNADAHLRWLAPEGGR